MSDKETNISEEIQVTKRNLHTGIFLIIIIGMFLTYWAVNNISNNYVAAKAIENDYSSFTENGEILWKKNSEPQLQ
jgi:hypothetical protein